LPSFDPWAPGAGHKENGAGPVPERYDSTPFRAGASYGFYATLCINVSGSFLIGLVVQTVQARAMISPLWRPFLVTGVLGGYTTFSTFSLEALSLATDGLALTSLFYVAASVVLGIAAAFGGIATGRALAH